MENTLNDATSIHSGGHTLACFDGHLATLDANVSGTAFFSKAPVSLSPNTYTPPNDTMQTGEGNQKASKLTPPLPKRSDITKSASDRQGYKINARIQSTSVFMIDKFHVGLLKDLPCPDDIQTEFDKTIRPDLENHIRQATMLLPSSLSDEKVMTEVVLCLAGKKSTLRSASGHFITLSSASGIATLKPTVWIFCGSRACRAKVRKSVQNLLYLEDFLLAYHVEGPHVSLHAPWPSAGETSSALLHSTSMAFSIEVHPSDNSIHGNMLEARFVAFGQMNIYRSTIGGLIMVNEELFILTSAHAIVSAFRNFPNDFVGLSETENGEESSPEDSLTSSSESDDSETDWPPARSGATPSEMHPDRCQSSNLRSSRVPSAESPRYPSRPFIYDDYLLSHVMVAEPKILAYMGSGTTTGDYSFQDETNESSDFMLLDPGTMIQMMSRPDGKVPLNQYNDPKQMHDVLISSHIEANQLSGGAVWILSNSQDSPTQGFLLKGDSSLILRGVVLRTRKIQVAQPGFHGMSGSWVVRDGQLCGIIYAAYDRSPYLHMLTADQVFGDIESMLGHSVRVATPADVNCYIQQNLGSRHRDELKQQIPESRRQIHERRRRVELKIKLGTIDAMATNPLDQTMGYEGDGADGWRDVHSANSNSDVAETSSKDASLGRVTSAPRPKWFDKTSLNETVQNPGQLIKPANFNSSPANFNSSHFKRRAEGYQQWEDLRQMENYQPPNESWLTEHPISSSSPKLRRSERGVTKSTNAQTSKPRMSH
ncbi:hypothetical protein BU24DRAFT_427715 [Aaosphaeria arxii CBS 175.79]|uniref:Trypsin-like serine protease n=1 Tax=Aaosphaeria arxii CBS 175.79 TaxID=1450172 RepID=A0A6A5XCG0_9PLEO|nr:uncharacterized protein BU24DRAFT_427715 [Aaosphaeria arxii CBS 175.79]KAF2010599.1 hypothetical protein BU24DRAFT_427715 [Aaosphaeria arxii CBS 175.79]